MRRTIALATVAVLLVGLQVPAHAGDTVGLVDPVEGQWHIRDGSTTESFYYGNPGDIPFMGDWDCDGIATPGLFRQSDAFAYLRNSNDQGVADIRFFFGNPSDIPISGDFNGDGCDTLSIYRPSEQRFYIVNALGQDEGGLGAADFSFVFGNPGDKPFSGDFDGDGITEVGLHRESTGFVYYRNTLTTGNADNSFFFGDPGDRFIAGDWSSAVPLTAATATQSVPGDSVNAAPEPDTPAIFRPGDATFYFRNSNSQGNASAILPFGESDWLPVAGDTGGTPLGLQPPPRDPSPPTSTSFDCANPFNLDSYCTGDTDPAAAGDESWVCTFSSPTEWGCTGGIDSTDAAAETWACNLDGSAMGWDCAGDIDKRTPGTESWSCDIQVGTGWVCSGDIDRRTSSPETWACTITQSAIFDWDCTGDVDRTSSEIESFDCGFTSGSDWSCVTSHTWLAPIVAAVNGVASAGTQASGIGLSEADAASMMSEATRNAR